MPTPSRIALHRTWISHKAKISKPAHLQFGSDLLVSYAFLECHFHFCTPCHNRFALDRTASMQTTGDPSTAHLPAFRCCLSGWYWGNADRRPSPPHLVGASVPTPPPSSGRQRDEILDDPLRKSRLLAPMTLLSNIVGSRAAAGDDHSISSSEQAACLTHLLPRPCLALCTRVRFYRQSITIAGDRGEGKTKQQHVARV